MRIDEAAANSFITNYGHDLSQLHGGWMTRSNAGR